MLFPLIYIFLLLVGLPRTVVVIIVVAALCGYPRSVGRRLYAIAIVPLAWLSATIFNYIRAGGSYDSRESVFPYPFLLVGLFVIAGAAVGCVLAALFYQVPAGLAEKSPTQR
jgi:hypothetical protein